MAKAKTAGMARQRRKLEAVAYHEAGHAVVCFLRDRPFRYATIVPDEEFHGRVMTRKPPKSLQPDSKVDCKALCWIEREILAHLAGLAAEYRHAGRHNWRGASQDLRNARELADYL